jgi:hypothetical protein
MFILNILNFLISTILKMHKMAICSFSQGASGLREPAAFKTRPQGRLFLRATKRSRSNLCQGRARDFPLFRAVSEVPRGALDVSSFMDTPPKWASIRRAVSAET